MIEIVCSAVLFDLDGVLIDSTPAVTRVWAQWATEHQLHPEDVVRHAHGRPSIDTIRHYLPQANAELENREVERREIADIGGIVALPGARELLSSLPVDRWTIVTSGTRPLAETRLHAAGLEVPEKMVTADDITRGKPDPQPYQKAANLLSVLPRDCVVVEDVPAGVCAGKAAGARVIAVRTTSSDAELESAGASWVVDGCNSISVASVTGKEITLRLDTR
jgi:mannitol-1-/sugar-/sorbitol-6-phosphatase